MGKKLARSRRRKYWEKVKKRYHDKLVEKIDSEPEELGINKAELVYKERDPELLTKGRETVDNLFLIEKENSYEILLIEVKVGKRQGRKGMHQLDLAWRFFEENWLKWLKRKLGIIRPKEVWLTLLLLYSATEPLVQIKDFIVNKKRIKLGKIKGGE